MTMYNDWRAIKKARKVRLERNEPFDWTKWMEYIAMVVGMGYLFYMFWEAF